MKTLSVVEGSAYAPHVNTCGYRRPVAAPVTVRFTSLFALIACACFFAPAAHAQWQTVNYTLRGGWNAIYLHGDANHAPMDQIFPASSNVISVWRWNPNPNPVQFGTSTLIPTVGAAEWSVWTRATNNVDSLTTLPGQSAYLVECSGTESNTYVLPITQKILPPRSTWVRDGANFLGFPTRLATTYPTFSAYFATFPAAIAANAKIYKYAGGPLGPANPVQVFSPAAERVDRTQAYWFEATVVGDFYAPLEVIPANPAGLVYGRAGSQVKVTVRNRTAATVTLTVAPADSDAAPAGQTAVADRVPLTRGVYNTTTGETTYIPFKTGFFNVPIGPQAQVELSFGVDRAQLTGNAATLYASLLRFTESGNLLDVYLPVSAQVASLSGLWVGDAQVSAVVNKALSTNYTCFITRTRTSGATVTTTTVDSSAKRTNANVLGATRLPEGSGGTLTYQWRKDGQPLAGQTNTTVLLTTAEAQASGAFGTATVRSFPLRILLHVDSAGEARLLSQVFLGRLATATAPPGICTVEGALEADAKASAMRLVAAHLPTDTVADSSNGTGSVALGQILERTVIIGEAHATNPFIHTYHPDHDNLNSRFTGSADAGAESPTINRTIRLAFSATPPVGTSALGWGSAVLGGTYIEEVGGLHKDKLNATGTFELRRVSEIAEIKLTP